MVHDAHVVVRVEVDQANLLIGVSLAVGPDGWRRDRMITADDQRKEILRLIEQLDERLLDVLYALAEIEHRHCNIADLADLHRGEIHVVVRRVRRVDRPRFLDRVRSRVCAICEDGRLARGDVDDADVEGRLPIPGLDPVVDSKLVRVIPMQPLPLFGQQQVRNAPRIERKVVEVTHVWLLDHSVLGQRSR